ncbi:hypothetical protein [Streptomyces sp. NPDC007355]|uniref:hypothetical protein n=1 Tax=Streptomyces sp. NPDC007355 TaxID=3364778 RepID=UPI0036748D8F
MSGETPADNQEPVRRLVAWGADGVLPMPGAGLEPADGAEQVAEGTAPPGAAGTGLLRGGRDRTRRAARTAAYPRHGLLANASTTGR